MAKTKISEFSSTPANNTDIDSINIAEGCAPSGINNAIRELMAQLKDFQTGAAGDSFNGPVGTTTAAAGAFTTLTASSTATLNTLASSGATLTGGSINNMTIGGTTAAAVSATTLTTSGAVTLNGGTANSIAYLNGSKVLTTGSALTFDGTNLGVGTASPTATGNYRVTEIKSANATSGGMLILGTSDNSGVARLYNTSTQIILDDSGSTSDIYIKTNGSNPLLFGISNTEQMRLTSTGLGIGTTSPLSRLTIEQGGDVFTSGFTLSRSGADRGTIFLNASNNTLNFGRSTATSMSLGSSGNLGLGVTPSAWNFSWKALEVGGVGNGLVSNGGVDTRLYMNTYYTSGGVNTYGRTAAASLYVMASSGQHQWFTAPSGTAGNAISFTQALTLSAVGNLLLGGTTDPGGTKVLYIANGTVPGTPTAGGVLYVESGALKYKGSSGTVTTLGAA